MLTIRQEQLAAFEQQAALELRERLADWLCKFRPDLCQELGQKNVVALVQLGVSSAARFGIRLEADHARYLNLMIELAPAFAEEHDWAGAILRDEALQPSERLRIIAMFASTLSDEDEDAPEEAI